MLEEPESSSKSEDHIQQIIIHSDTAYSAPETHPWQVLVGSNLLPVIFGFKDSWRRRLKRGVIYHVIA